VSLEYPGPRLRRFCDLDVLTDDARSAQSALLAAGFVEIEDEESDHHLCALQWPGLPLAVEVHSKLHWPRRVPAPTSAELIANAVPSRLGVDGVTTLAPAEHTLTLAAHAWAHDQLGRLGNLIDVAVMLERTDEAAVEALARRWGCYRLWRTTRAAVGAVLEDSGRSAAVDLWARHLRDVRDRTVIEWHTKTTLAPMWGLPRRRVPGAVMREAWNIARPGEREAWGTKLRRAGLAARNARSSRSDHLVALGMQGDTSTQDSEAA
jgi:hypothetical protein